MIRPHPLTSLSPKWTSLQAQPPGGTPVQLSSLAPVAVALLLLTLPSAYADTANGTGWKGTSGNNWSTTANWDSTAPNTSGTGDRNLFFGQGYKVAGGTGSTS